VWWWPYKESCRTGMTLHISNLTHILHSPNLTTNTIWLHLVRAQHSLTCLKEDLLCSFTKCWCFQALLEQVFQLERWLFSSYSPLLRLLSSQSVSNALFTSCLYEAPPSEKHTVLWLVRCSNVLWLVECFECVCQTSRPLP